MQDALSSLRPLRLESLGLLDRDGLIDAKIALRCFVANSAIPIEIVALDQIGSVWGILAVKIEQDAGILEEVRDIIPAQHLIAKLVYHSVLVKKPCDIPPDMHALVAFPATRRKITDCIGDACGAGRQNQRQHTPKPKLSYAIPKIKSGDFGDTCQ